MTDDLVAFVRARIAEERADAEAAIADAKSYPGGELSQGRWVGDDFLVRDADAGFRLVGSDEYPAHMLEEGVGRHIGRQDPAATIARCDALAALVDAAVAQVESFADPRAFDGRYVLGLVAAIWSGHADFRQEWAA